MFEQSLVESTHVIKGARRWTVWASIAIQAVVAAILVIVPLMHPETIGHLSYNPPQLVLPTPPPPPPPPVHTVAHEAAAAMDEPAAAAPQAPHLMPAVLHSAVDNVLRAQADGEGPPGPITNLPNGMGNATNGNSLLSIAPTGSSVSVVRPTIVHLSTGVTAGLLYSPIQPVYPPIARAAHMQGTVTIHAIISRTGHIESATVVGGPVMLQSAALDAVKVAHYHPYLLNDQPTEVDTTIIINFHLNE